MSITRPQCECFPVVLLLHIDPASWLLGRQVNKWMNRLVLRLDSWDSTVWYFLYIQVSKTCCTEGSSPVTSTLHANGSPEDTKPPTGPEESPWTRLHTHLRMRTHSWGSWAGLPSLSPKPWLELAPWDACWFPWRRLSLAWNPDQQSTGLSPIYPDLCQIWSAMYNVELFLVWG